MSKKNPPIKFEEQPFIQNANVPINIDFLSDIGQTLSLGGFLPGFADAIPSGRSPVNLGFLEENVTLNPEITQRSVDLATRDIVTRAEDFRLGTLNQLEANNQLTSSVANTALSELNEAFNADIADVSTTFFLADVERALANRLSLFETGLNTVGGATNLGLTDQQQRNQFALQQQQNRLAAQIASQPTRRGGLFGGLTGALGGGLGGAVLGSVFPGVGTALGAGLGALSGGAAGAFGPQGTGGQIFGGGGTAAGLAAGGFFTPTTALTDQGAANRQRLQQLRLFGTPRPSGA